MKRAVCNELFGSVPFEETCDLLAINGFHGIEIAPFTLAAQDGALRPRSVQRIRRALADSGIAFAGFHWLLAHPAGLHATAADAAVREAAWAHLKHLVEVAGELGGGPLVFGSPRQRTAVDVTAAQALAYMHEGLAGLCGTAAGCGSAVLMEALPKRTTNVVNTLDEASQLIAAVGCPGVGGMFDFHNCADELLSWSELIDRYAGIIQHVHLNTRNGGYPRRVRSDYRCAFRQLAAKGYRGWVSLEIFHEPSEPAQVLQDTARFLDRVEAQLVEDGISRLGK